jgi:hypothetical protein
LFDGLFRPDYILGGQSVSRDSRTNAGRDQLRAFDDASMPAKVAYTVVLDNRVFHGARHWAVTGNKELAA